MSKVNVIVKDKRFTFSSNEQIQQVDVIGRLMEAKLKTLEEIDQEVLPLCNVDEIPQEIEESEKYLEKAISSQKGMNDVSQQNEEPQETNLLADLIQTLPAAGAIALSVLTNQVKTKLTKLPKFRGDITTWKGFGTRLSLQFMTMQVCLKSTNSTI